MPDANVPRFLTALLPTEIARDIFEPAWWDLRFAHLTARAESRNAIDRFFAHGRYLGALLLLIADCWRISLLEAPRLLRERRHNPPALLRSRAPALKRVSQERIHVLAYHLRHAIRRLINEPAFTIAAVLTLALGVGANVAVFTVVEAVLLRPLPYPEAERLVILNHRDDRTGITKEFIAIGDYIDLAARQTAFESFGAYGNYQSIVYDGTEPYRVNNLAVTSGALAALRVRPLLGRTLELSDGVEGAAPVMLIGYELWQNRFAGDPNVVGRSIKVGNTVRTIVGVAPRGFRFPPSGTTDLITNQRVASQPPAQRKSGWTFAVARLKPGKTMQDAVANLTTISRQMATEFPQSNQASTYFALPLRDALVGNTKPALVLLLAAVTVVLLIACANVANLLLARSLARQKEMALRLALGAGRGRLATQLLSESFVLAVAASLAGLAMAHWGARALVALVPQSVNVPGLENVDINGAVLGFALLLTVGATLGFGLIALLTVRGESPAGVLVGGARATMSRMARRATSTLVVVEVAFAVMLLLGAGLILRSFAGLMAVKPGFEFEHVLTMDIGLPGDRYSQVDARVGFYARAFEAIRALPEVREIGTAAVTPLTGNNWTVPFERPEHPVAAGERPPEVGWQAASGGYFKSLQIPLLAGRLFGATDRPGGKPVVIVSEAIQQRYFPGESAVGKFVKSGNGPAEIVGVVGNIRRAGLRDDPRADMYFPFEMSPVNGTTLFIRTTGDPTRPVASIQRAIKQVESSVIFGDVHSMSEIASESVRVTKLVLWLLGIFAGVALALAVVGIYGVMSYVVRQRTREIGTRIALGAPRGSILWLVMRQGVTIAGLGAGIGVIVGVVSARFLDSILFATKAAEPIVLVIAPLVLILAVLAACVVPARRAASVDPAKTLAQP